MAQSMNGDWWVNVSFRKRIGEDKIKLASGSSQQTKKDGSSDSVSLSEGTPCHTVLSLLKVYRSWKNG